MTTKTIPVTISLSGAPDTRGTARVVERSPQARFLRAALGLVAFWVAAGVCVFIPVFHFVLVPGLAAAGLVFAGFRLREGSSLMGTDGACPRCQAPKQFPPSGRWAADGGTIHCDQCGSLLTVKAA